MNRKEAKTFAEMFIEDLPDTLKGAKEDTRFVFSIGVYESDPELEILKQELNKIGYDIECTKKSDKKTEQSWKINKL